MELEANLSKRTVEERPSKKNLLPGILKCSNCAHTQLQVEPEKLTCQKCMTAYPLIGNRFPDFLIESDRVELAKEAAFWTEHFGGQVYEDESEESYQAWAQQMAVRPQDKVLEIGCGSGALLRRLNAQVRVGLEPVVGLLEATEGFVGVVGSAIRMPFADASFDLVFFKHSLHHVQDKALGLKEAARITRPGGRVVVIEPNADHPQRRIISNPDSFFRKLKFIVSFIGPVETFQTMKEVVTQGAKYNLKVKSATFHESHYDNPSVRQKLQKVYSRALGLLFFPKKFLFPNYCIEFVKS